MRAVGVSLIDWMESGPLRLTDIDKDINMSL